jgi:hypothetical protein
MRRRRSFQTPRIFAMASIIVDLIAGILELAFWVA